MRFEVPVLGSGVGGEAGSAVCETNMHRPDTSHATAALGIVLHGDVYEAELGADGKAARLLTSLLPKVAAAGGAMPASTDTRWFVHVEVAVGAGACAYLVLEKQTWHDDVEEWHPSLKRTISLWVSARSRGARVQPVGSCHQCMPHHCTTLLRSAVPTP
jgi:hypothetical protein